MLEIFYTRAFLKRYSKLDNAVRQEVKDKVEELRDPHAHKKLKVHKLKKPFIDTFAFSVNYKVRILFSYSKKTKKIVFLLTIGGHDVYR